MALIVKIVQLVVYTSTLYALGDDGRVYQLRDNEMQPPHWVIPNDAMHMIFLDDHGKPRKPGGVKTGEGGRRDG